MLLAGCSLPKGDLNMPLRCLVCRVFIAALFPPHFPSFSPPFFSNSSSNHPPFCPFSPFFFIFRKKSPEKFCQFRKSPYLCTRFRKATGAEASDALLCSLSLSARNSIFDRLRTEEKDKAARALHIIYNIYGGTRQASSHSFYIRRR